LGAIVRKIRGASCSWFLGTLFHYFFYLFYLSFIQSALPLISILYNYIFILFYY